MPRQRGALHCKAKAVRVKREVTTVLRAKRETE